MRQQRIRRSVGAAAIVAVTAFLLAGCHDRPVPTSVHVELNCVYAGVPLPEPPPDQPGSITITADSPTTATEGSTVPVVRNATFTDVDLPIDGDVFTLLDVEGGTWNGQVLSGHPAIDPATPASVTLTTPAPGHVTVDVFQVWVVVFIEGRPLGYMCSPTNTPPPLADIAVRAA